MISPELIRRFPFFAELNIDQIGTLSRAAHEITVEEGHFLFHEGDLLNSFYFVVEGEVNIVVGVPDRNHTHSLIDQLNDNMQKEYIPVSTLGPGEMFGWSGLIPPHKSTAGAVAKRTSRVIVYDCQQLRPKFESDCQFAYLMVLKAAQTVRQRLRDMHIESLAFVPERIGQL